MPRARSSAVIAPTRFKPAAHLEGAGRIVILVLHPDRQAGRLVEQRMAHQRRARHVRRNALAREHRRHSGSARSVRWSNGHVSPPSLSYGASHSSRVATAMSGRSEIIPSTPQSNKRRMSSRSLTTHTCRTWPCLWTCRTNAGDTTRMRPAYSGTWKATYGWSLIHGHRTHDRCSVQRASLLRRAGDHLRDARRGSRRSSPGRTIRRRCDRSASALSNRRRHRARQLRLAALHLDDDARRRMPRQHVIEQRHADALAAKRMRAVELEAEARIDARELGGGQGADGAGAIGRAIERGVVNDDGNAVGGELDVDLEAVGAERHAVVDAPAWCSPARASRRRDERRPAGDRIGRRRARARARSMLIRRRERRAGRRAIAPTWIAGRNLREGRGKPHLASPDCAASLRRTIPISANVRGGIARAIRLTRRGFDGDLSPRPSSRPRRQST